MASTAGRRDEAKGGRPPAPTLAWRGQILDVKRWRVVGPASAEPAGEDARDAVARARDLSGRAGLRHLVVGVIGPRDASATQQRLARDLGRALGELSVTTICGGRGGVMEAVCEGVADAEGLSIGILPGYGPEEANPFVGIPLPTGLSEGRNMVIARSARVLIAVGGSYGTLTEIAYGLHFAKTVIALDDAPQIEGAIRAADVPDAVELCCEALLRSAAPASDDVSDRRSAS